jgi:superfamily II DNA or RNA helicase
MPINYQESGLWLDLSSLVTSCNKVTYARALELYRSQRVFNLTISPVDDDNDSNEGWFLAGEVQGSERYPYEVTVDLQRDEMGGLLNWDSDCSCPVGYQCKHGVALLIKAAYKGFELLSYVKKSVRKSNKPLTPEELAAHRQASAARAQEIARLEAEARVMKWLEDLEVSNMASETLPELRKVTEPRREYFLYLLSISGQRSNNPTLTLEVVQSYKKVTGGWAKSKALKIQPEKGHPIFDLASEADHDVLQLMRTLPTVGSGYYYSYTIKSKVTLQGKYGIQALELASSTGRLFVADSYDQPQMPATWGRPQVLCWKWQAVPPTPKDSDLWALSATLENTDAQLCLNDPPLYLHAAKGLCGLVDVKNLSSKQLGVLLNAPPMRAEALKRHQPALMQQLGSLPLPPVLEALPILSGIVPRPCLHLTEVPAIDVPQNGLIQARLTFDYAGHKGWWAGQGTSIVLDDANGRMLLQRDPAAELDAMSRLLEFGLVSQQPGVFGISGAASQQNWLAWADEDYAVLREAGFEVTTGEGMAGWISHADDLSVKMEAQGDDEATSPWFDLSLGMEINGVRHNILPWLPQLINAAAKHPRDAVTGLPDLPPFLYLRIPEGGFVRLPTEGLKPWIGALLDLVGDHSHDFSKDSLKLSRFDAMRTTAALGQGAVWEGAQYLREMVQRLCGHTELPETPMPASVNASLRPYQQQGVNWLQFLREYNLAGILADDMGLGKTLQTLVHIQIEKDAGRLTCPALIIAPVSLMGNWRRETERFCPNLRALVVHGKDRHEVVDTMSEQDIVIAPYSLLHRDRERWLNAKWYIVVLDEAQNIKNATTNAAQVATELKATHRLCLSGTPMENHLGEIWSLFHFLMPGFLGSHKRFTDTFRTPIEKLGDADAMQQLRARITPFMLRRTKALVADELPPKIETITRVELSGKQADLYETIRLGMEKTVRDALNSKGLAKSQITILDALLKLRQVCCDPQLVKIEAAKKVKESAKLEHLMTMLPEMLAEGRRILLFSQFTSMLTLIEAELVKQKIKWVKLTGQSQKRDALIEQFTNGEVPLFLISLKAGGVGLNLPQADTVIHYDPWWNPAVENQATDRAHRIGQTQSVWVVKLVAQGTIEERILALQERKAALAQSVYSGSVGRKQPLFTESDLTELLKPLSS